MAGKHKCFKIVNGLLSACPCWIVVGSNDESVEHTGSEIVPHSIQLWKRWIFWEHAEHFLINLDEDKQQCRTGTTNSSQ